MTFEFWVDGVGLGLTPKCLIPISFIWLWFLNENFFDITLNKHFYMIKYHMQEIMIIFS